MTFDLVPDLSYPLGVVPIVVNAGAALGPLLLAPIATFFAILFKPKELIALIRRKPWLPVLVILVIVGLWFALSLAFAPSPAQAASARKADRVADDRLGSYKPKDWTSIALNLIRDEQMALKTTGIKPVWEYSADDGLVLTTPAVADDLIFAGAAVQDGPGFLGELFAVDRAGVMKWKIDTFENDGLKPFFSSPVLSSDKKSIIIGQGLHDDKDCALICVDAATGRAKWQVKTSLHIESTPAVWKDLAVAGAGAIEDADHKPKSDPGFVFAVEISTGKQLWKHPVNDPESSPAIAEDGSIYIGSGFNGNAVVALRSDSDEDLKSKKLPREIWKIPAPYPITGPVTVAGDLILVGGGNSDFVFADPNPAGIVLAINRKDGSIKWQTSTEDAVLNRIVVQDGKVFCPVRNGNVLALNLADGKQIWKQPVSGKSPIKAGIAVANNTVFAVSSDGYLALLNAADGKLIEKHPLNAPGKPGKQGLTVSTPLIDGQNLYVGSETAGLHSFQMIQPK